MARKPGAFDLRCDEAVLSAMLAHPTHGRQAKFLEWGEAMVCAGNWAFARHLPVDRARQALKAEREPIARKQSASGLWFKKHAEEWSRPIIAALEHAGLIEEWLADGTLRPIPALAPPDRAGILARQSPDGSWDAAVTATAMEVERLLSLGERRDSPALSRAGKWLLAQFREEHECCRKSGTKPIVATDVFSAAYPAEWRAVEKRLPHMKVAGACYMSAPMIQTALALRALLALGLGGDARVERGFESLLDLRVRPGEKPAGTRIQAGRFGSWCGHQVAFKLEDRARAKRMAT